MALVLLPLLAASARAELGCVFGTLNPLGTDASDRALSSTIASAWVRFARAGDPNGEGLPAWPAYGAEEDECLELGDQLRVLSGLRRQECGVLAEVREARRQAASPRKWY